MANTLPKSGDKIVFHRYEPLDRTTALNAQMEYVQYKTQKALQEPSQQREWQQLEWWYPQNTVPPTPYRTYISNVKSLGLIENNSHYCTGELCETCYTTKLKEIALKCKESGNAEGIRSNEGQVHSGGTVEESRPDEGRKDLEQQAPKEPRQSYYIRYIDSMGPLS